MGSPRNPFPNRLAGPLPSHPTRDSPSIFRRDSKWNRRRRFGAKSPSYRNHLGSSLPMIGDWDTGRQPTVALREPMAQRGQSKIDAGGMVVWERLSSRSLPHRRRGSGRKPLLQKPSFCRSGFRRDHCVIEDGGLGLKSYLNRSCDERKEVASAPLRSFGDMSQPIFAGAAFAANIPGWRKGRLGLKALPSETIAVAVGTAVRG